MDKFYIACELGAENGRIVLGNLHQGKLGLCEIRRFKNELVREKDSLQWNIPHIYQEIIDGLRAIGSHEEPVASVSCTSWGGDYMLFGSDGSLITPTYHQSQPQSEREMKGVLSKVPEDALYEETGIPNGRPTTLGQLVGEKSRRLGKAGRLMPVADGFNYLLGGVPRIEMSLASATQLFNPSTRTWSDRMLKALSLRPELLPAVVPAGTELGPLRPELVEETRLDDLRVITSCSHEIAAALMGLPLTPGENWAYLQTGSKASIGTELLRPILTDASRQRNFTNEIGYGGAVRFSKQLMGDWLLKDCLQYWKEHDREMDPDVLMHLAIAAEPFESLVDLTDSRFQTPGDMPMKIQAFCKETGQTIPRKPGPATRCVLESLTLLYRRTLREMEELTGRQFGRLYILGTPANRLLHHFTANALQIPTVIAPADTTAIGNIVVQAMACGHFVSLDHARGSIRTSFKTETIMPHAAAWDAAYRRLARLTTERN